LGGRYGTLVLTCSGFGYSTAHLDYVDEEELAGKPSLAEGLQAQLKVPLPTDTAAVADINASAMALMSNQYLQKSGFFLLVLIVAVSIIRRRRRQLTAMARVDNKIDEKSMA